MSDAVAISYLFTETSWHVWWCILFITEASLLYVWCCILLLLRLAGIYHAVSCYY